MHKHKKINVERIIRSTFFNFINSIFLQLRSHAFLPSWVDLHAIPGAFVYHPAGSNSDFLQLLIIAYKSVRNIRRSLS